MVIKNDNNQDSIVIQQGDANRLGFVSGPNLRIVKQGSPGDPITILESSTGERAYTFGPVFESEEDARLFAEFFELHHGISLAEFLAPIWEMYEQFMAEQQASGETPATNE